MVLRFWGATGVYAETFADLVVPSAEGIRGDDLARGIEARGWTVKTFAGDSALIRSQLAQRRPVIVLLEDRPGRFHYVVIVGWTNRRVILHDPARAPFRVLDEAAFDTAWQKANRWTMLALPGDATDRRVSGPAAIPERSTSVTAGPCAEMVDEGVRLSAAGALDESRRVLEVAIESCPGAAAPWRELAGLRAVKGEWMLAGSSAREALRRDPRDEHAWRILATSRFLEGDPDGALDAWNHVDEPLLDIVNVTGLERTRYRVATDMLRLRPDTLLRRRDLQDARRRLGELPSALGTRVTYVPGSDGRARVEASVIERPLAPTSILPLASIALRGLTDREARVSFASVTGGGELWTMQWRWWERRQRASLTLAAPAPRGLGGVWSLEASSERQTYATALGDSAESRRGAALRICDWTNGVVRWHSAVGVDRWGNDGTTLTVEAGVARIFLRDRLVSDVSVGMLAGGVGTWTVRARGEWHSNPRHDGTVWLARAGYDVAGSRAPLALWPGAGSGPGRDVLLRAHPMLDDGVIRDAVFGRRLAHGGVESRRWFTAGRRPLRVAVAGFVDVANAARGIASSDLRLHADAGIGVRVALAGAGVLRVDLARGLRDGNTALSVGWTR